MSVGGLTKYQKSTHVPTGTGMFFTFNHSLGITPKFVVIKAAEGETVAAGNYEYVIVGELIGAVETTNASTGNKSRYVAYRVNSISANSHYEMDDTHISIRQYNNSTHWAVGVTYDIELWG